MNRLDVYGFETDVNITALEDFVDRWVRLAELKEHWSAIWRLAQQEFTTMTITFDRTA